MEIRNVKHELYTCTYIYFIIFNVELFIGGEVVWHNCNYKTFAAIKMQFCVVYCIILWGPLKSLQIDAAQLVCRSDITLPL